VAQVIDKPYESSGIAQALALALKGNGNSA
jgi:hypothetical protein